MTLVLRAIIEKVALSVSAAFIILLIRSLVASKRWLENIVVAALFLSCSLLLSRFDPAIKLESKLDVTTVLQILSGTWLVSSMVGYALARYRKPTTLLNAGRERYRTRNSLKGWRTSREFNTEQDGLRLRRYPSIPVLGKEGSPFAGVTDSLSLGKQLRVYHVISCRPYVSWIDAQYWAFLRRLSQMGIPTTIFFYGDNAASRACRFQAYVRRIAGPDVEVDREVFGRFDIRDFPQPPEPVQTRHVLQATCAQLLPALLGSKETLLLIWQEYLRPLQGYAKATSDSVRIPVNIEGQGIGNPQPHLTLSLAGLGAGFLGYPSAVAQRDENERPLVPSDTLLLANNTPSDVAGKLSELSTEQIRLIAGEIIAPQLPLLRRILFKLAISSSLIGRTIPRSSAIERALARCLCANIAYVHNRIVEESDA